MKAAFILPVLFLALLLGYAENNRTYVPKPAGQWTAQPDCTEGGEPGDTAQVAMDAVPQSWTPHQVDSLLKHLNIYCMFIGDTTGRYVQREVVMRLLANQHYRGRDSSFVFQGDDCIRIELRLGLTASVPDTILWINLCQPVTCFDSVTVALGCYDTIWTVVQDTQTVKKCDTVCVQTVDYQSPLKYFIMQNVGMASLVGIGGCRKYPSPTSPYYTYLKFVLYAGRWYGLTDTLNYHHFVPAADSCYIRDGDFAYFLFAANGVYGPSPYTGQGPWYRDSMETLTGTIPINCLNYGLPGVARQVTNCRDTLLTSTRTVWTRTWVGAGKDTTIWTNTCDCYVPNFVCATAYDTLWHTKYIYDYVYTRDSVQCEKEYAIPLYTAYPLWPKTSWQICRGDPEIDTAYARFLSIRWAWSKPTRTSVTQVHIRASITGLPDTCWSWSCMTDDDIPPVGATDFFIERDKLNAFFPCPGPTCEVEQYGTQYLTDWCCEKDTTAYYVCLFEGGTPADTVSRTFKIPDRTGACSQWTYTDWTITDSTLIDSLQWFEITGTRTYYQLAYIDTCCHDPKFNGLPFPCDFWLINDCGDQLYPDGEGHWHIPCPSSDANADGLLDGTDYEYISNNDRYLAGQIDTVRDWSVVHETAIDGIRDTLALNLPWTTRANTSDFTAEHHKAHIVDATGGNVAVTLPSHVDGFEFVIKRTDASGNTLTITGTVDATENPTVASLKAYRIISDGSAWHFIGQF